MKKFKINPNPKQKYFFDCLVFDKHKEMIKFLKRRDPDCPAFRQAFIYEMQDPFKLGTISLNRELLTSDSIVHEVSHATLQYFRRKEVSVKFLSKVPKEMIEERPKEELFCYTMGHLYNQIQKKVAINKVTKRHNLLFDSGMKFYNI